MNLVALRTALFTKLDVTSLTNLLSSSYAITPIFYEQADQLSDAGDEAEFPYVVFDITSDVGLTDKGTTGTNAIVQVDVFSRDGSTEAETIGEVIHGLLHRQTLAFTGFISTECEDIQTSTDPDGETRRCMLLFRVLAGG